MPNIRAPHKPHHSTWHGIELCDPLSWLKPDNWAQVLEDPSLLDPETRALLDQHRTHYNSQRDQSLEQALYAELRGRMPDALEGVPLPDGDWEYHWRYAENASHPEYLRRYQGGPWECYFDAATEAEGHEFYDLGTLEYAPTHQIFALTLDTQGNERYRLSIRDTQSELAVCPEDCQPQVIFSADAEWALYIRLDEQNRGRDIRAWHWRSGQIKTLYHEDDTGYFLDLCESQDGRWGLVSAHQHAVSEIRLLDLQSLELSAPSVSREQGWDADIEVHRDRLILKSNHDRADFALYTRPIAGGEWTLYWQPSDGLIDDYAVLDDFIVVLSSIQALPELRWRAWDQDWQVLELPEALSDLSLGTALRSDHRWQRLNWSSPRHPSQQWQLDLDSGQVQVLKTQQIPSGHDPEQYVCERAWAGPVPLTILRHKDHSPTGVVLYGYGAYGISLEPNFGSARLSLVDRGIVHITAHVRGGMELGYDWYLQGLCERKTQSFDDFEAALDVALGIHPKVVIHGGSAGGMLVAAVLNRRPGDIAGMLADVPFVDVLNTMLDPDLPLTPPEWPEWGNPIASPEAFARIQSYSPYDNLQPGPYPEVLVTAGLTDPRVTFWEPLKYVSRLAECSEQGVYLRMEESGHGGASGRFGPLQEVAECYSWMLRCLDQSGSN